MKRWKKRASRKAKRDRRPASVYFRLKSGRDSGDRVYAFVVTRWKMAERPIPVLVLDQPMYNVEFTNFG